MFRYTPWSALVLQLLYAGRKGGNDLMLLSLRKGFFAVFVLMFVFHIADNSFQYQRCLLKVSNQRFPDMKLVRNSPQCNGSADGGLFRLFP